ncbi:MAG: carboxylating nicotinate-nucleotide diphosphorylase [Pseudomonadota bacterium]
MMTREFYPPAAFFIDDIVKNALQEDFGHGWDVTSQIVIPEKTHAKVQMTARERLPVAGLICALSVIKHIDPQLTYIIHKNDGDIAEKNTSIMDISGSARSIMAAERVILNFVGHLSGIALKTAKSVAAVKHTKAKIVCTRKTLPNLRALQKYAVRLGGGFTHRSGVDDCILIKDNHIAVCGGIEKAVQRARSSLGHTTKIEVECDHLGQVEEALKARADIIMLDNMSPADLRLAVETIDGRAISEASGGITEKTIKDIAETGVDMISIGALTHSAAYADVAFDFLELN